ncbi:hypothetical protein F5148DRAFT_170641 [Russula earlei]|uniref:Uncharacterized protein n=1 Tax=Russula earlei TaxID=71964 RepID=A0ACC0U5Q9_9AGAM|nr:hypothetical protein F5148DRAFT_170641 [Russula earlei]
MKLKNHFIPVHFHTHNTAWLIPFFFVLDRKKKKERDQNRTRCSLCYPFWHQQFNRLTCGLDYLFPDPSVSSAVSSGSIRIEKSVSFPRFRSCLFSATCSAYLIVIVKVIEIYLGLGGPDLHISEPSNVFPSTDLGSTIPSTGCKMLQPSQSAPRPSIHLQRPSPDPSI